MNRNYKIILLLVLLSVVAYWLISSKPWQLFKSERKDFAVADTASITRIFLADKRGGQSLLQREANGSWSVNKTFPADQQKINLIKSTLHDMVVRNPLSDAEFNTIVARLASDAVKVEVYAGEQLLKTIYVGQATPDGTGTYMLVDGSSAPFVTHIPGFVGYLSPRFLVNPLKWKDKLVFGFTPGRISTINVDYPTEPNRSFFIQNGETPVVKDHAGKPLAADLNFVKYYIASFNNLYLEAYDEDMAASTRDSIRNAKPFCIIEVNPASQSSRKLSVYLKPIDKRTKDRYDEQGNELPFDRDKYYAFIDNEKDLAYIQEYNFGRLFKGADDFRKSGINP